MNFSEQLLDQVREAKRKITPDLTCRSAVIAQLKFLYDACVASEELLKDAFLLCPITPLGEYYKKHLTEEAGEIEILKSDLGEDLPLEPSSIAMAMIGSQYYMIKHIDPVCLLGYMAVMEADPTPISVVERLEELHGHDLFGFLRLHATRDLEHAIELKEVIDSVSERGNLVTFSTNNALAHLSRASKEWTLYGRRYWIDRRTY